MSERLNSVDIEDVLSSIRRLVSDEQRPAARAAAQPAAPAPAPADVAATVAPAAPTAPMAPPAEDALQGEKLILTPALRIAPGPEDEEAATPDPAEAPSDPAPAFHSVRHAGAGVDR